MQTVIDVSTGSGFHAVQLKQAGFDVVATDGSPTMLTKARSNFRRYGLAIPSQKGELKQCSGKHTQGSQDEADKCPALALHGTETSGVQLTTDIRRSNQPLNTVRCDEHGDGRPAIGFDFIVVLCLRLIEAGDHQKIGPFDKRGKQTGRLQRVGHI